MTAKPWIALFLIVFVGRLAWIGLFRYYAVHVKHSVASQEETFENGHIARNLVSGRGYSMTDLDKAPATPSAHKPPLYPFLLAGVYKVFGIDRLWPVRILQACLTSVAFLLISQLFSGIFDRAVGRTTLWLCMASPALGKIDTFIENTSLAILFSALFFTFYWRALQGERAARGAVPAGLFMGLTMLTNPSFGIFFAAATAILAFRNRARQFRGAVILVLCAGLVMLPWALRNHRVFRRWIPVTTTIPNVFYVGNNPEATGSFLAENGKGILMPPNFEANTKGMNEDQAYRYLGKLGWEYAVSHPRRFLVLRCRAFFYFWMTSRPWLGHGTAVDVVNVAVAIGMVTTSALGFFMAARRYPLACLVFALLFSGFALVYAMTIADSIDRYRLPLDPYLLGFSSIFLLRFTKGDHA